ncbi:MAG: hypothetical protein V4603_00905 [Pseudomonadota bacterium]
MTNTVALPSLEHDCNSCSGLCCVVLPFDAEQGFGFDKPAQTACSHLRDDFLCGIHEALEPQGFRGCIHFTCHGAGQRVTRLFGETNWRSMPESAGEIFNMFKRLQKLHELQFLLHTACSKLDNNDWQRRLTAQQHALEALCQQAEQQNAVDLELATEQTMTLLRQLATEPAIVALRNRHNP